MLEHPTVKHYFLFVLTRDYPVIDEKVIELMTASADFLDDFCTVEDISVSMGRH